MKSTAAPATKSPTMLTTPRPTPARMVPSVRSSGKTAPRKVTVNYKGDPSQDVRQGLKDIKKGSEEVLDSGKAAMAESSQQARDDIIAQAEENRNKVIETTKKLQENLKSALNKDATSKPKEGEKTSSSWQTSDVQPEPKKAEKWEAFNDEEPDKAQMQSSASAMRTGSEDARYKSAQKVDSAAEPVREAGEHARANLEAAAKANRDANYGNSLAQSNFDSRLSSDNKPKDNYNPQVSSEANMVLQEPVKKAHMGVPREQLPKGPEPYEVLDSTKLHAKAEEYRSKHPHNTDAGNDKVEKDIEKSWQAPGAQQQPKQAEKWEAFNDEEPDKAQMQSSISAMRTGSEAARNKSAQKVDSAAEQLKESSTHANAAHIKEPSQDTPAAGDQTRKGYEQELDPGKKATLQPQDSFQTGKWEAFADEEPGKAQMQSSASAMRTGSEDARNKSAQKVDSAAEQLKESSTHANAAHIKEPRRDVPTAGDDTKQGYEQELDTGKKVPQQDSSQTGQWEFAAQEPAKAQMQSSASAMRTGSEDARFKTSQKVDSAAEQLKESSTHANAAHIKEPSQDTNKGVDYVGKGQVLDGSKQANQPTLDSSRVKPNEGPQTSHLAQDNARAKADQYPPQIYKMTDKVGGDVDRSWETSAQEPDKAQMQSSASGMRTGSEDVRYKTSQKVDSAAEQLKEASEHAKANLEVNNARIREGIRNAGDDLQGQGKDFASQAQAKGQDFASQAQSTGQDFQNKAQQTGYNIGDNAQQTIHNMGDKAQAKVQQVDDKVQQKSQDFSAKAQQKGQEVGGKVEEESQGVLSRAGEVTSIITGAVANTAKGLFNAVTGAGQSVKEGAVSIKNAAGEEVHEAGEVISDVTAGARHKAADAASDTRHAANKAASHTQHAATDAASSARQNASDAASYTQNAVGNAASNTQAAVSDAATTTRHKMTDAAACTQHAAGNTAAGVRDTAADAGAVTRNKLADAVEYGADKVEHGAANVEEKAKNAHTSA